ncbi:asparagine synthase (glutamine-hydrolyzing) [Microvirga massiliensis]|uniref:asparagine synthase (glutamine-hydrolyzing) n=1 Tax=Microvirga massiliensis TaxID=1033741 RepID=UPI00062B99DC|nr:asparagine synthase (glutamine-hydrolyzing) [Microvirga massiliensis]
MCGLNGIFSYHSAACFPKRAELIATRDYMHARGPDGAGEWWSEDFRAALGHRRLSILDLSERASQPMVSLDGQLAVVFNGEIYNTPDLRTELERRGVVFRTTSDTEVLLHLFAYHGEEMVHHLRGMFAFAIWDEAKHRLFLARDPYGIKPLYTANDGWTFRFASQVKALLAGRAVSRDPEPAGIVGFHLWGSVPEPFTMYREIRALPAGHTQWIDAAGPRKPVLYASVPAALSRGVRMAVGRDEITPRIRAAVLDSVRSHLLADVEVGMFLSAGVDSGAVLGLMRDVGQAKVRAITLAFEEFRGTADDELPLAAEVARLYGAEHVVRTVSEREFQADLPVILDAMDQPSVDGVNTWFVSKAAREAGLKVALSGLGGDELLAGYPSFRQIPRWVAAFRVPAAIPGAGMIARAILGRLGLHTRLPKALGLAEYGGSYAGAYLLRRGLFLPFELKTILDPELLSAGMRRLAPLRRLRESMTPDPRVPIARVAALESANYMRNQLLRDADWAGMAHSIEIRTPLVDFHLLKALAAVVPSLDELSGKHALAMAPKTPLPVAIVGRAKTGFGVPTGHWIAASSCETARSKGAASRAWGREVLSRMIDSPKAKLA